MQSGFRVNVLFWSGECLENCWRISQRILMANLIANFSALFFKGFRPPQKIHAQNSRPELSAFISNFTFLNPKFIHGKFLLTGETNIFDTERFGSEVIQEPLPLRPRILVKKIGRFSKTQNGFTKTVPWTENPVKIRAGAF